jgi:hypothetical protein
VTNTHHQHRKDNTTMTTTIDTRPDGTEVPYRYGEAYGEKVSDPHLVRSAKRLVNAAVTNGWRAEFTSGRGSTLIVHLTPLSPVLWKRVEDAGAGEPNRHRKWVAPARIDLLFDPDTGAYLGGTVYRTWEAPLKHETIFSALGDSVSDAQTYIEFPQRWLNQQIVERKRQAEAAAAQAEREAVHTAFLAADENTYAIRKLEGLAEAPVAPDLSEASSPRQAIQLASIFARDMVTQRFAQIVLSTIGWPDRDGNVITVSRAVNMAAATVSRTYERNGAEAETLEAIAWFLDQYWAGAK